MRCAGRNNILRSIGAEIVVTLAQALHKVSFGLRGDEPMPEKMESTVSVALSQKYDVGLQCKETSSTISTRAAGRDAVSLLGKSAMSHRDTTGKSVTVS